MAIGTWGQIVHEEHDPARTRRLAIGYVAGFAVLSAMLLAGAAFGGVVRLEKAAEEEVDVKFVAKTPEPPPPEPAPEPVVHVKQAAAPAAAPAPRAMAIAVPTAIPTEKPAEAPAAQAVAAVPIGSGDPRGAIGGTGTGSGTSTSTVPGNAPVPGNSGPIQLPEDAEPPVAIVKALPAYPEDARAQGIETTITVKFVVLESGEVSDVRILRGHPMFDALVIASVKTWRFQPATVQGRPIRVFRVTKIPFKLRT